MHEFKGGELPAGKFDMIVLHQKQAIALALSEANNLKNFKNNPSCGKKKIIN